MNPRTPRLAPILPARRALALLRLALLVGCLCALLLAAGLQRRTDLATGRSLLPLPAVTRTGLPFAGVNIDLAAYTPLARPAALAALAADGFGWVRQRFDWGLLEPQPGVYAWDAADAAIDAILAAGLVPVVVLDGSPAWARAVSDVAPTDNPLAPPANGADLARFAAAFAARYGDRVRFYQVWDEPNIAPHWGNRLIEPVAYAQLLEVTAAAIRAADPDAVIAAAALAPTVDRGHTAVDEVYFWQRMLAAGAQDSFDAVAIQPFGFGAAPRAAACLDPLRCQGPQVLNFQRAVLLRRKLAAMGLGGKAMWAVRSGWNRLPNAAWGTVTAPDQARYAAAAYDIAWAHWPWLEALGWAVDQPAAAHDNSLWGFALTGPDGAPAPVRLALADWLDAHTGARPHPQPLVPDLGPWLLPWLAIAFALALLGWRTWAAARLLPWAGWIRGWRRLPWFVQGAAWVGLAWLYYIAVWPPLIGLCWLLWALLCLTQPRAGLALAALLLPFYFQHKELPLVDMLLTAPPATAAVACLLPATLLRGRQVRWRPAAVDGVAAALLAISLLSAAHAWHWPAYGSGLLDLVLLPLGLWFAVRVLGKRDSTLVALALFAGGVLVAVWGLAAWLGGGGVAVDGVRRLVGPHFSPNHTALYLLRTLFLGCGLAAGAWAVGRRRTRGQPGRTPSPSRIAALLLAAAVALVLLALVLTGSRGALLLGLPVGALALGWLALRRRPGLLRWLAAHRVARLVAVAGLLVATVAAVLLWDRLLNRHTLSLRIDLWEASLRLWRDYLLLGVGPGGFFWRYPAYLPLGVIGEPNQLHPHNVWLEVATTWGLLGFGWLGLLLWQAAALWQDRAPQPPARAWLTAGLLAGLLAAFAHAQMDAFFLLPDLAAWNLLALALVHEGASASPAHSAG